MSALGLQKGGSFSTTRVTFSGHIGSGFATGDYYLRQVPGDYAYVKTTSNAVTIVIQLTNLVIPFPLVHVLYLLFVYHHMS